MVETALVSHGREGKTKSETRRLRREGKIPANVYGKGQPNVALYVDARDIEFILGSETGKNTIINLALPNNKRLKTMVREVQKDPIRGEFIHIDFHQISLKDKIHTEVPVVLTGEPIGVAKGAIFQHGLRAVEVTCLPADIPEKMELAIDGLDFGDHVSVADLAAPPGVTIVSDPEMVLVALVAPRLEVEPGEEAKEPVLITREKGEVKVAEEVTGEEESPEKERPAEGNKAEEKQEILV